MATSGGGNEGVGEGGGEVDELRSGDHAEAVRT
jgi:hypothetical protein